MNNDIIELLKFVGLHTYDIDKDKTTIHVLGTTSEIDIQLFFNRRITECPYCHSLHTVIKETIIKDINHPIIPQQKLQYIYIKRNFYVKSVNIISWRIFLLWYLGNI